jgi:hypothetical protein
MNVGKLYQVQNLYWMIYPSKEAAAAATHPAAAVLRTTAAAAACYGPYFNCNVSYIEPSIFCLLEKDGEFIRILTTNGEVGWIYLADWCKDDIEEMNQ